MTKKRVLMVCLGNTCRSPIAEAIFIDRIKSFNLSDCWEVDSAALKNYHVGKSPNSRAEVTLRTNGIIDYSHNARIIITKDFDEFDWILGMDEWNISELNRLKPQGCRAKIELLGKYYPGEEIIIQDPYCDPDITGFLEVFHQCKLSIENFLNIHQCE